MQPGKQGKGVGAAGATSQFLGLGGGEGGVPWRVPVESESRSQRCLEQLGQQRDFSTMQPGLVSSPCNVQAVEKRLSAGKARKINDGAKKETPHAQMLLSWAPCKE